MRFTLFTPVYNRAHTLDRVWRSIQTQTRRDFEWICVDDGSTDAGLARLEEYRAMASFPVTLIRHPENRGKHVAWNAAVAVARGELFVPCDADDEFDADSLAVIGENWAALSEADRMGASGVNVLCRDAASGKIVGEKFPASPMWSNNLELFYRHRVGGEKWGCVRTELLKPMLFPEIPGYYGESRLWYELARRYRVLCLNIPLRTYYRDQSGNLSAALPRLDRLPAMYDYACWHLRENWDYIRLRPVRALGEGSNVFLRARLLGIPLGDARARLHGAAAAAYWPLFALVGWLRYLRLKPAMEKRETAA